MLDIDIIIKRT